MLNQTAAQRDYLLNTRQREFTVRLEILDRQTERVLDTIDGVLEDAGQTAYEPQILPGGSVRVDPAGEVLRTAAFSLIDPYKEISVGVDGDIGMNKRFRISKGYKSGGVWDMTTLGTFELSGEPRIDPQTNARVIPLQLGDKSSNANGRPRGGLLRALRASQGLTKLQAIQAIAGVDTWGETNLNLWQGSTATLTYDLPWEDNKTPWEAAQAVNSIPEPDGTITRLYYDVFGRLTMAPDPGPNLDVLPAVWTAKPNPDGISQLAAASKSMDLFKIANAVQVKFGSQLVTPGVVWSIDTDPNSPTNVNTIGYYIWRWKNGAQDELIRNATEAQYRADFERRRLKAWEERAPYTILENLALEPWDVMHLERDEADLFGNYQLLSHSISLDANLLMTCEGWKVRKIV